MVWGHSISGKNRAQEPNHTWDHSSAINPVNLCIPGTRSHQTPSFALTHPSHFNPPLKPQGRESPPLVKSSLNSPVLGLYRATSLEVRSG